MYEHTHTHAHTRLFVMLKAKTKNHRIFREDEQFWARILIPQTLSVVRFNAFLSASC